MLVWFLCLQKQLQAVKSLTNSASLIFCQIIYVQATDESSTTGTENKKRKQNSISYLSKNHGMMRAQREHWY